MKQGLTHSYKQYNEDLYVIHDDYVLLMDGATDLKGNDKYNAYWFVHEIAKLIDVSIKDTSISLKQVMYQVIDTLHKEHKDVTSNASASIILIRKNNSVLECLSLGDCYGFIKMKDSSIVLYDDAVAKLDDIVLDIAKDICINENVTLKETRQYHQIKNQKLIHRELKNTDEGYYILDASGVGIQHSSYYEIELDMIEHILLMSDGFSNIVSVFHLYKDFDDVIKAIQDKGLNNIINALLQTQERDTSFMKYPRLKHSDDATVVYIKRDAK